MRSPLNTLSWPAAGPGELPRALDLLRGARLPDGTVADLRVSDGEVVEVAAAGALEIHDPAATLDLEGWLLLTAPAEPHAHLDKARSFELIEPPLGDLDSAITAWRAYAETMSVASVHARAREQALLMLSRGITAIRTHVDVHPGFATRSAAALVAVREELSDLLDLQIVALASPLASPDDIEAALDLGLDLVGGAPHLAPDPEADVDRLVAIAARRGLGMDLHTDENLNGALTLPHYARAVQALRGAAGADAGAEEPDYSASHCVRLGTLDPAVLDPVLDEVAAADLGVISLPITNLYLQGWEDPVLTPRGLTALRPLLERGIRLAAGADNVRDPFNPVGRSCAFETASLLVVAGHLSPAEAWHLVGDGAREVMGLRPAGPRPGGAAELLAVRSDSLTEAIAEAPADRLVIHRGRLVGATQLHCHVASPRVSATTGVL